jgi:hypothetical protein
MSLWRKSAVVVEVELRVDREDLPVGVVVASPA